MPPIGGHETTLGLARLRPRPPKGSVRVALPYRLVRPLTGHGTVTFTYTVSDGQGGLTTATVTVDVEPVAGARGSTADGALARTGAQVAGLVGLAALLLAAGSVLLVVRRRGGV